MTKLAEHSQAVLDAMVAESKDGVWEGRMTELVNRYAPLPYYSNIVHMLKESGAIVLIHRGGGSSLTQYHIVNPKANLKGVTVTEARAPTGAKSKVHSLEDRVTTLEKATQGVNLGQLAADFTMQVQEMQEAIMCLHDDIEAMKKELKLGEE